jgi:hypothetical protein
MCCVTFCPVQLQMASYLEKARQKEKYAPLKQRTIMYIANAWRHMCNWIFKRDGSIVLAFSLRVSLQKAMHWTVQKEDQHKGLQVS